MKSALIALCLALVLAGCQRDQDTSGEDTDGGRPKAAAKADAVPWDRYAPELTAVQAAALYWSLNGGEPDYEQLGRFFIEDWPRNGDAFAKQDRIAVFKPGFEAELRAAPSRRHFVYDSSGDLDHYLPAKRAFPLRLGNLGQSSHQFGNPEQPGAPSHELRFSNLDDWSAIAVADETLARRIEAMVADDSARLRLYLLADGPAARITPAGGALAQRAQMNSLSSYVGTLGVRIMRIAIIDDEGRELAATLPSPE